jgi:hypothetical protein
MPHHRASSRDDRPASASAIDVAHAAIASGAYMRSRDLPRLVPVWPHELATQTPADHLRLLAKLRRALRAERQRGLAGHWAYDLARHAHLLRAYRCETAAYLAKARKDRHALCADRAESSVSEQIA